MARREAACPAPTGRTGRNKPDLAQLMFRFAVPDDAGEVSGFLDRTLAKDCFLPAGQVREMIARRGSHRVLLGLKRRRIVAVAIATQTGRLLNLIVDRKYRNMGIGAEMMRLLAPPYIRAKTNMSTGDPTGYYQGRGYTAGQVIESAWGNRVIREMRRCHLVVTCGQAEASWPIDRPRIVLVHPRRKAPRHLRRLRRDLAAMSDCCGAVLHEVRIDPQTGRISKEASNERQVDGCR